MQSPAYKPDLRLVGHMTNGAAQLDPADARQAVTLENRRAAHHPDLDPADPRWVLAAQTQSRLEGSLLPPEQRERIERIATRMGVRPFEANLIMAIVQDQARRGATLIDAAPLLSMVRKPELGSSRVRSAATASLWLWWSTAVICTAFLSMLLINWLLQAAI